MVPVNSVTRIKLKRDSFKLNNKFEPNKRRWTGPKPVSGLNPLADQVQDHLSSPADVVSPGRSERASGFDGATKVPGEDGGRAACGPGTSPSRVSRGGARGTCTRGQPEPKKRLSEHKNDLFYRLRLALCFARGKLQKGGKRVIRGSPEAHALSFIESSVSLESGDVPIRASPPGQPEPQRSPNTGAPGQEKPRRGRGRPRKTFNRRFGASNRLTRTTSKTEVRSKARRTISGRAANLSSKVKLRRRLRSDTRKQCKRLVKNACCALCGDVKFTAPSIKNLARFPNHRPRAGWPSHRGSGRVPASVRTPSTPAVRFEKYPLVKLCDVGPVFAIASRDFSCVLPTVLRLKRKRKSVCCLKKEFGFLVHPHLHGIKKRRRNNQSREISTPTYGCASLPSGDPPSGATGSTCVSDTAEIRDGSFKERDACLGRNPDCEGMRRTDAEGNPSGRQQCDDGPVACPVKSISESPRCVSPLILRRVPGDGSRGVDDPVDRGPSHDRRSEGSDGELSSCQRTQAYTFLRRSSCARTSRVWPFPRRGPPEELRSSLAGHRWIDTSVCSTVKDVENKLSQQHESRGEALEGCSSPDLSEHALDDPRHSHTQGQTRRSSTGPAVERRPSAPDTTTPADVLKRTLRGLVHNPRVILTRVSEQCQVLNTRVSCERVNKCRLNGLSSAASSLSNTHLLQTPGQDALSAEADQKPAEEGPDGAGSVDQNTGAASVTDQEGNGASGRPMTPGSLSGMCLRVELLKAQRPSATALQENSSEAPQSPGGMGRLMSLEETGHTAGQSSDEDAPGSDGDGRSLEERGSIPTPSAAVSHDFLDVSRAYEEDVLVLDVIQDDPELFGAVVSETPCKPANHCRTEWDLTADCESLPTAADVTTDQGKDGGSLTVKKTPTPRAPSVRSVSSAQAENTTDWNNNHETRESKPQCSPTVINTRSTRPVMDTYTNGREATAKETPALRVLHTSYCWFYFSEHNVCLRPVCWFLHVPRDGDEKFCMDTVRKFCHSRKHSLVLRAVEVFVGYYSRCAPSVSFSQETVNFLLSSLLDTGSLREFELVANVLLKHKKLPSPEIVLAVFKLVRDRDLTGVVPELIVLTSKIVEAGCVFSVDQCEVMQSHLQMMQVPRQQMDVFLAVKCRALATNPHTSQLSDLSQAVVSVEMLKHQEDWAALALAFCRVCVRPHSPGELLRFCCCVTMALLKEPKDKLTLPYELFAQSVCQQEPFDEMIKTILGRIGVSLIFRYHRTREWTKGVKLVSVMFGLDIEFITLKGLMGNEHRVSRCQLVTMATELFLHSGSIEGALKMLRADDWFVSSSVWPCEQTDVESRKRVLTLLAGKTSHRDTFEILTNLPGLRQPIDGVQIQEYTDMFCAHLRLCVLKQTLPVAADLLEFMLTQGMEPETQQLQTLIHKLGKQNNWSRARALFRRARAVGFYSTVVCEADALFLPCSLSEIEMTLTFEMFITLTFSSSSTPAGPQPLLITLQRLGEQDEVTESVYLAAGCRLLSAALIPNPKLSIRYTAVNPRQEQLFQLERGSAHRWFSQNQRWAQDVWKS